MSRIRLFDTLTDPQVQDRPRSLILLARSSTGLKRWFYRVLTLGSDNLSERSLRIDDKVSHAITIIGIPSAFLLHGYVGFIFGSVKANPWWSIPLMPIVFLFSAIVSEIATVLLVYMVYTALRGKKSDGAGT